MERSGCNKHAYLLKIHLNDHLFPAQIQYLYPMGHTNDRDKSGDGSVLNAQQARDGSHA